MKPLSDLKKQAIQLDEEDPLKGFRKLFMKSKNKRQTYLCSNSLGLPSAKAMRSMQNQMLKWADLGVEGWFNGNDNWYAFIEANLKKPLSLILGAELDEAIVMNSLTVNLHLLLISFYQPKAGRYKILMESPAFPSDLYAIKSHIKYHGLDPDEALVIVKPRCGEHLLREEDIKEVIHREGHSIALVFLSSVNFLTGQVLDMEEITRVAKAQGCLVGYDIAHAAGNIPLKLHDWKVDFAVGCSYKYLCSGPGGPGIAFVHAAHHQKDLPRLSGWWGNDPSARFQMHLQEEFVPYGGADSWQVSTPSIIGMTPLADALSLFQKAGMGALRLKSEMQTKFLLDCLQCVPSHFFEVITPKDPKQRGSQLSLLIKNKPEECLKKLEVQGFICDFRPPNIIRVTPFPLYNTYQEVYNFVSCFHKI
jgi:kynureninase